MLTEKELLEDIVKAKMAHAAVAALRDYMKRIAKVKTDVKYVESPEGE